MVKMSRQFGLPYLPMIVIEDQHLLEKKAKVPGLDVTTAWTQRVGPAADLDALLSGNADFIGPGVPTLATVWDKTTGTPQEVRALIAMQSMPYVLVTRNPEVKTIADFTDRDKIALPAVKLTGHAIDWKWRRRRSGDTIITTSSTDHYHPIACGCSRGADIGKIGDRRAFRQRAVLLLRARNARHPSGPKIL